MTLIDRFSMTRIERNDLRTTDSEEKQEKKHHYYLYFQQNECQKHCAVTVVYKAKIY
jgi:hypothetical protein